MVRSSIRRDDYESSPHLAWNAFIDLISDIREEMTPRQLDAGIVFVYESEVQNGGHLQYFANHGSNPARITIGALARLGAYCQEEILVRALELWDSASRPPIKTAKEYSAIPTQGEFDRFDRAYHQCSPSTQEHLEHQLKDHFEEFIELV